MDPDPKESLLAKLQEALASADVGVRNAAILAVADLASETTNNAFGFAAVKALAATDDVLSSRALLQIIAHGHGNTRAYALNAIARSRAGDPQEIMPQLITLLADPSVHGNAAWALTRFGPGALAAAPKLLELLETAPSDDISSSSFALHRQIASTLTAMGRDVLPLLLTKASSEKPWVRIAIANVIENFGSDAHEAAPYLLEMLSDPSREVRGAALDAIVRVLPPAEAAPILVAALDSDDAFADHVVDVLARTWVWSEAVPHLLYAFASNPPPVSTRALRALEMLGVDGIRSLLHLMHSDAPESLIARQVLDILVDRLDRIPGIDPHRGIPYSRLPDDERLDLLLLEDPALVDALHEDGQQFQRGPIVMHFSGPSADEKRATVLKMVKRRQAILRGLARELRPETKSSPAPMAPRVSAVELAPIVVVTPKKVPDRFTDVVVYSGHFTSTEDLHGVAPLTDDVPFVPGQQYTLEVAIRRKRRGVSAKKAAPRATKSPHRDDEDALIYVLAQALWKGITIEQEFLTLTWPHNSDSGSALFRLTASADLPAPSQGAIEIRLYDGSLDLLDIVSMSCTVSTAGAAGVSPRQLNWPDPDRAVASDPNGPERFLSIHVRAINRGYQFDFLVRSATAGVVRIPVLRDIQDGDLEALLIAVRNFWTRLVVTHYEQALSVTKTTFDRHLGDLRDLGERAWTLLFGSRFADQSGAGEAVGKLLAALEGKEGDCIQVTHADRFTSFVFPWSILYPPTEETAVDPTRFWGARYQIEQVTGGSDRDTLSDEPVKMAFVLDPSFGNSSDQTQLMRDFRTRMNGRLKVTKPISDEKGLMTELTRRSPAHLFYFFCHGYTASGQSGLRYDGVKLLKSEIEELPENSAERRALGTLLALTAKMNDESWIYVGGGEIKESRLRQKNFFSKRRPLIFLNMCQSAELVPSLSSGFVRVFLDKNACAIVGTECPMTAVFAHEFAKQTFDHLLNGAGIGAALWEARRYFLSPQFRNPLGLAYTLYGRAGTRLGQALATKQ